MTKIDPCSTCFQKYGNDINNMRNCCYQTCSDFLGISDVDTISRTDCGRSCKECMKKVEAYKGKDLCEFRLSKDSEKEYKIGEAITVETLTKGEKVSVTTKSKGKGFQGVVRRHGFAGSPATHGHKDQLRMPGSIGATDPQRVFKGKRMGGQMGNQQVTLKNLTIARVEVEKGLLYLMGGVPGARGALLKIKTAS